MTLDAAEIGLVRKTFESALADHHGDVVALLTQLDWAALHDADPMVATGELFEAQGRLRRTTSALDVVVLLALGDRPAAGTAVVHPRLAGWYGPPGVADGDTVRFDGLVVAGAERAQRLLVPFDDEGRFGVAAVGLSGDDPLDPTGADIRPVAGLDPSLRLVSVTGAVRRDGPRTGAAEAVGGGDPAPSWEQMVATARRALAHELCGLAQAMLDRACAHVTDRHQFGRPIAAFQTVRHRLTESFVALVSARAALDASWATGEPLLADAAKVLAGRAGQLAARHCLQVTGALGFTEEYDLAADIRRVHVLDALYGSADALQAYIGARLLTQRSVPRLHALP
jgi:hypothetical protein